jgi:cytochrome c oxidase assembly protein subunit 15
MGYRLPLVTTIAIYVLMIIGSLVVGLNAGFACPDWPLCQGHIIPPLNGLVLIEYVHRFMTTVVTVLILAVVVTVWRKRQKGERLLPALGVLALFFLGMQVLLGAVIVVFVLPGAFTTIDVANSMCLLATLVVMTVVTMEKDGKFLERYRGGDGFVMAPEPGKMFVPGAVMAAATFLQIVAGAYFRHSGASGALFGNNAYLASHHQFVPPTQAYSSAVLDAHVFLGMLLVGCTVWFLLQAFRYRSGIGMASVCFALVMADMALGMMSLATRLNLMVVTAHWSLSALLFAVCVSVTARARMASAMVKSAVHEPPILRSEGPAAPGRPVAGHQP